MNRKKGEEKIKEICIEALSRAVPNETERRETLRFCKSLIEKLRRALSKSDIEAEVQIQGSIAKDTWLAGEKDIDVFILLKKTCVRDDFHKVLDVVKRLVGENYLEAYAEHPYIEAEIERYTVDFVPAFKIEKAEEAVSSVDRTPLHTEYVKRHLDRKTRDEVRLLKRFMRGIGTYGAEIKVGGFSGYLCELLTFYYGSFIDNLKAASKWRKREVIDIEGYYNGQEHKARKIFQDNLIVVDPVDKGRNVASAVREERLNEFIAASREFLKKPDLRFFYPAEIEPLSIKELIQLIKSRGSTFIFLKFGMMRTVPDVLWGQLYKSQKALRNLLRRYDFNIVRDGVWSDEKTVNILLFEIDARILPSVKRHLGPPVAKKEDCERFLQKHLGSERTVSGPRIEGDRWVVEICRKYVDVVSLLRDKLSGGGRDLGVANLVSESVTRSLEVLVNEEILEFYSSKPEFAKFLTEFIYGRPRWMF